MWKKLRNYVLQAPNSSLIYYWSYRFYHIRCLAPTVWYVQTVRSNNFSNSFSMHWDFHKSEWKYEFWEKKTSFSYQLLGQFFTGRLWHQCDIHQDNIHWQIFQANPIPEWSFPTLANVNNQGKMQNVVQCVYYMYMDIQKGSCCVLVIILNINM